MDQKRRDILQTYISKIPGKNEAYFQLKKLHQDYPLDITSNLRINYVTIQLCKGTLPNTAKFYLFKINKRDTRKRPDICSKLIIKLPERRH